MRLWSVSSKALKGNGCPHWAINIMEKLSKIETYDDLPEALRVIAFNIDASRSRAWDMVIECGWQSKFEHYHNGKSEEILNFGLKSIPYVLMVDKDGDVVYQGEPRHRDDIQEDLYKLCLKSKLTGDGILNKIPEDPYPEEEPEETEVPDD